MFKIRVVGRRKKEGTGVLALKIMTIVQESRENKVERHDLEEMVQKEIVRVYIKEEGAENKMGEMDGTERKEGGREEQRVLNHPRVERGLRERRMKRTRNGF